MDEIELNMLCFTMGRSDISVKQPGLGPALELMGNHGSILSNSCFEAKSCCFNGKGN